MKKMKKILSLALSAALLFGLATPYAANADATVDKQVDVNIHKILMNKTDLDAHKVDKDYRPDQGIADLKAFFGASAEEIQGVYFVAIKEGETGYDNFDTLSADEQEAILATAKRQGLTQANGLKLTLTSPGKYKIYEVKSKSNYAGPNNELLAESKAVPVVLELPKHAETENGLAKEIHVYPKNTQDKPTVNKWVVKPGDPKVDGSKDTDVKEASFNKNEEHTWAIEAPIPTKFKDYRLFDLVDELKPALSWVKNQTIVVKVKEDATITLTKGDDYTVTEPAVDEGGTLTVSLTAAGIAKLAAAEGKTLRVEFKTTINDNAVMGEDIVNNVKLKYGHDPNNPKETEPGDKPKVYTGGKRFVKIDSDKAKAKLEGAKFVVKNRADQYLYEEDGKYVWKDVADATPEKLLKEANIKILTSNDEGLFEIKGLKYERPNGTQYALKEVQAPKGYALLTTDIDFIVNDTSYQTPNLGDLPPQLADPQEVDNKKITIPQTGGMGTVGFIVVGLLLMAGAAVAIRRRSA